MSLSTPWQDNCSTINSAFRHMLKHEIVVDAVFKKDKFSCLYAHKLVLSIWSPKLADLIAKGDKKEMFSTIFQEDVDVLKIILQYLYSAEDENCFSKLPFEKLIQALEISERYEINHVYRICLKSVRCKKVNPSNVMDFFDLGLRKDFNSIIRKCINCFENKGISIKYFKDDFSINTLLNVLSLNKIAMNTEADLLELAINWLSCYNNKHFKAQVLSFIDLQSINFREYRDICKKFPEFFSDVELSSIMLSKLREDPKYLPHWYKPMIKSVTQSSCSFCINIHKQMAILKPLPYFKCNKRKDLKSVTQEFEFHQFEQIKLLSVELSFGPNEIPPKEFILQFSLSRTIPEKEYYVDTTEHHDKYKICFKSPLVLKSKATFSLKFNFRRGLIANNIFVLWPLTLQKLFASDNNGELKVKVTSSQLAFFHLEDNTGDFIVSSFYFNACDNHDTYLSRKWLETGNISRVMNLDPTFEVAPEEIHSKSYGKEKRNNMKMEVDDEHNYNMDATERLTEARIKTEDISRGTYLDPALEIAPEEIHNKTYGKEKMINIKVEVDDEHNRNMDETEHLNAYIKTEDIALDLSNRQQHSSFHISTYNISNDIKQEIVELSDG